MELQVNVNSYMTLDEAKQLVEDQIVEDAVLEYFETLSDNFVSKLINRSTKLVNKLHFKGYKVDSKQELNFPRYVCEDYKKSYVECPEDVKIAIALQAIYDSYFLNKEEIQLQKLGVSSKSLGSVSVSFSGSVIDEKLTNGIYKDVYEAYLRKYTIYA